MKMKVTILWWAPLQPGEFTRDCLEHTFKGIEDGPDATPERAAMALWTTFYGHDPKDVISLWSRPETIQ